MTMYAPSLAEVLLFAARPNEVQKPDVVMVGGQLTSGKGSHAELGFPLNGGHAIPVQRCSEQGMWNASILESFDSAGSRQRS
jgi:hypothetical protein